ncbi:MAG: single-stranded DNA-binding protein [Verrucomicrobia bacterium GWC2_42_7]|nr:MAG: single-stranded DNA-binding protein [Verrucomicrobia bacterium GWC2_42_7]
MASFNKVIILGNLVRDPEVRVTSAGFSICKLTLATSRVFRSQDGSSKEETAFIDVEAFGRHAETISKYFVKGKPIFIEGRLRLNEWESNTGEKRSKLLVVLEGFEFVGGRNASNEENMNQDSQSPESMGFPKKTNESIHMASKVDVDEDVPF